MLALYPMTAMGAGFDDDVNLPTVAVTDANGQAYSFKFKPSHPTTQSKGYSYYGEHVFTKNYYGGMFPIFMPYKTGDTEPWKQMTSFLKENNQTKLGAGGQKLVPGYYNIKKGAQDPTGWGASAYLGDNTGNMYVPYLKDYKNVEFRYQGYLLDGTVVDNPYFPDDVYGGVEPWKKNWYQIPQVTWTTFKPSLYNDTNYKISGTNISYAQKTFETWFANSTVGAKFKEATPSSVPKGQEWIYWNKRFQIQGNIQDGSVIITAWHNAGGRNYYQSFPVPSRPANNITVTELELVDKETGDVLESYYRKMDYNDPMNIGKMKIEKTDGSSVLQKGTEYILRGKIYYTGLADPSKNQSKLSSRALQTVPAFMNMSYAYDGKVNSYNTFDKEEQIEPTGESGLGRSILPGEEVKFEITDYKVPGIGREKE